MLEALISVRTQGEIGLKKAGDILCVKPAGSPWGRKEKGAVVEWDDAAIEVKLEAMRAAGEPHPVIVHPYAEYERVDVGTPRERVVMVNRSSTILDLAALDKTARERIVRRDIDKPPIPIAKVVTRQRASESQGGIPVTRT